MLEKKINFLMKVKIKFRKSPFLDLTVTLPASFSPPFSFRFILYQEVILSPSFNMDWGVRDFLRRLLLENRHHSA